MSRLAIDREDISHQINTGQSMTGPGLSSDCRVTQGKLGPIHGNTESVLHF